MLKRGIGYLVGTVWLVGLAGPSWGESVVVDVHDGCRAVERVSYNEPLGEVARRPDLVVVRLSCPAGRLAAKMAEIGAWAHPTLKCATTGEPAGTSAPKGCEQGVVVCSREGPTVASLIALPDHLGGIAGPSCGG